MNGRTALKIDSIDSVKQAAVADPELSQSVAEAILEANARAPPLSLTHLRLSNTKVTAAGLEALVRMSPGQLELVDCDSMRIPIDLPWPRPWPKSTKLYGALGSHIWRPVYSSNLRVLRIHHSMVTQIPTLEAEGLSRIERIWLAETVVRERCRMAYPQASFVPDMNPRITSITLTKIPRRSSGPLIESLVQFLRLAAIQERDIADATISSSRRAPVMLRGLRHIGLEFEADPMDDLSRLSLSEGLDTERLLSACRGGFASSGEGPKGKTYPTTPSHSSGFESSDGLVLEGECVVHTGEWRGNVSRARVWVGTGVPGPHPAVNAYMDLVRRTSLRRVVGAASPAHVKAGVPNGSLLYLDAWEAILVPEAMGAVVAGEMRDVIGELKKYRIRTRGAYAEEKRKVGGGQVRLGAPHYFYTGRVEVVAGGGGGGGDYHTPEYWR